jgi:hypothetical protein
MFPDSYTVHRVIQTEMRLANAKLERRSAHVHAPPPSRAGGIGTAIRRVAASLGTLRAWRDRRRVDELSTLAAPTRSRSAAQQPS